MNKFLRVIDNETIEIARYRNPRIAFNDPNYEDISSYCDLKAIINPFTLYEENKQLEIQLQQKENIIKEVREYCLDKAKGRLERTLYDDILEILDKGE